MTTAKFVLKSLLLRTTTIYSLSLLMTTCVWAQERIPTSTQDYCANIKFPIQSPLQTYLDPLKEKMATSTGVYVLEQGTEAMVTRAWLSDHAQHTIDVQYFIFSTDNIGIIAIDYLVRAAKRGVKVRILVDDIMIDAKPDDLLKLTAHENIDIKIYNPNANLGKNFFSKLANLTFDFHGFNQRMHNKTFTVDGKVSITGGRNVADEYFGYDHQFNFRDRDVLLLGGITKDIENSFELFWQDKLSISIEDIITSKQKFTNNYEALHQYACNPSNFVPQVREQIQNLPEIFAEVQQNELMWIDNVEYISDLPGKNDGKDFLGGSGITTERLIALVESAKKSVIIQTPYLITTDRGKRVIKEAIARGVEVKILTNSLASNDNLEAFSGYQRDRKALLKTGAEIYEFKPDAQIRQKVMSEEMHTKLVKKPIFGLHAKSMVIDDDVTVIGTFNLDPRSANLNTESITVIPSVQISQRVKAAMLVEMQPENAWRTTLEWNPDGEESVLKRLRIKLRRVVPKSIL